MSTVVDFKKIIESADVPTTEAGLIEKFREIAVEEGVVLNNACDFSPFWRLVSALIAKPLLWLINLLHLEIFPALFLKTATGDWVDLFAWQLGLKRKAATKARGEIIITRVDNGTETTIPVGTVIQSSAINGVVYRLQTLADHSFAVGDYELSVIAEAVDTGVEYNLATGFYALMSTDLAGIVGVKNESDWLLVPGADDELDDDLKARCRNQFTAVNQWHIDQAYIAMLTLWPGVNVSDIYINSAAPRGPGTADAYILFDFGAPADEYIAQMQQYIADEGNHGFSDDFQVTTMPSQPVNQVANVLLSDVLDDTAKEAERSKIEQVIRIALRNMPVDENYEVNGKVLPTRSSTNSRFVWSKLIAELHQLFPETLISIDFSNDEDIVSDLWVPELDSLEVLL